MVSRVGVDAAARSRFSWIDRLADKPGGPWRAARYALRLLDRYRRELAIVGALIAVGDLAIWFGSGAVPHDTAAIWLGGRHFLAGEPIYDATTAYLAFWYAPPLAILLAPLSLLPLQVFWALILVLQVAGLRYVAGSWIVAGLLCWLPFVRTAIGSGNVDLALAAVILASIRERPWAGAGVAVAAMAKLSPALLLVRASRRQWLTFAAACAVLVALTLPWLELWPQWIAGLRDATRADLPVWIPLLPRLPFAVLLLVLRRPWSVAAGVALATPAFWFQSLVLLLPALVIGIDWAAVRTMVRRPSAVAARGAGLGGADVNEVPALR